MPQIRHAFVCGLSALFRCRPGFDSIEDALDKRLDVAISHALGSRGADRQVAYKFFEKASPATSTIHELPLCVDGKRTPARSLDLNALVENLIYGYCDAGNMIALSGEPDQPVLTRPNALRRILVNLIDNVLKFGTDADVAVATSEKVRS